MIAPFNLPSPDEILTTLFPSGSRQYTVMRGGQPVIGSQIGIRNHPVVHAGTGLPFPHTGIVYPNAGTLKARSLGVSGGRWGSFYLQMAYDATLRMRQSVLEWDGSSGRVSDIPVGSGDGVRQFAAGSLAGPFVLMVMPDKVVYEITIEQIEPMPVVSRAFVGKRDVRPMPHA